MDSRVETGREFRRAVLRAGRATAIWDLLRHRDFAVDELKREPGVAGPAFGTEFDPIGNLDAGGRISTELAEDAVLRVALATPAAASRRTCTTAPPHRRVRRGERREDRRPPPHRPRADGRRPGRQHGGTEWVAPS
ncbi:hypothetical protein [Streptomyces sp. Ru72]|uniref:hypothetical protein n=1 Tax=Streptomyces sp. Ru72 TaxID=2080747 RepID=UPI000CDE444B|nr:hypothetical protein [Streptomyces sp. Ru72]